MKKVVRYPLSVEDGGNDKVNVRDGEDAFIFYQNNDLTLNQWKFVVDVLNKAGENGRYIPEK